MLARGAPLNCCKSPMATIGKSLTRNASPLLGQLAKVSYGEVGFWPSCPPVAQRPAVLARLALPLVRRPRPRAGRCSGSAARAPTSTANAARRWPCSWRSVKAGLTAISESGPDRSSCCQAFRKKLLNPARGRAAENTREFLVVELADLLPQGRVLGGSMRCSCWGTPGVASAHTRPGLVVPAWSFQQQAGQPRAWSWRIRRAGHKAAASTPVCFSRSPSAPFHA